MAGPESEPVSITGHPSELSSSQRLQVTERISAVIGQHGITNALLFAALASAESTMAHCWRDATWACPGPTSIDCDGGPVIAGAGDGPCSARQGGLGLFQFDAGTYEDTLRREGQGILLLDGSIKAAVDFVLGMLMGSVYLAGIDDRADAIAWLNTVRPQGPGFEEWIQTVTHYYNGCVPGRCRAYASRLAFYESHALARYSEFGEEFWYPSLPSLPTAPCFDCTLYEGELLGAGRSAVEPDGTYYFSAAGRHQAWLQVPDGADFDLRLYRWSGSSWRVEEASLFDDPEEKIDYSGLSGYYAFVVDSYRGEGTYRLYLKRP